MRRIMIARRNNIRDHETLKRARHMTPGSNAEVQQSPPTVMKENPDEQQIQPPTLVQPNEGVHPDEGSTKDESPSVDPCLGASPRPSSSIAEGTSSTGYAQCVDMDLETQATSRQPLSDNQVREEMDVLAVESTRSYRAWNELPIGAEFVYNQRYVKGHEGHDWLLRKNIWRRMRYRRENKRLVARLRRNPPVAHEPFVRPSQALPKRRGDEISASLQLHEPVPPLTLAQPTKNRNRRPSESRGHHHTVFDSHETSTASSFQHHSGGPSTSSVSALEPNSSLEGHDENTAALQATVAAAAAILQVSNEPNIIMDPEVVEAAVAAAESFRSSTDHAPDPTLAIHDPISAPGAHINNEDESMPQSSTQSDQRDGSQREDYGTDLAGGASHVAPLSSMEIDTDVGKSVDL